MLIGIAIASQNIDYNNSNTSVNPIHAIGKKYSGYPSALRKVTQAHQAVLMYEERWATPWEGLHQRPQQLEIEGGMYNTAKNAHWTEAQKTANVQFLQRLQNAPPAANAQNGSLSYTWINRGPYNKPGSFRYGDLDSTDNTLWVVSNGHYGANQFIYKGSLEGDNFSLISGNLPTRYNDMIGFGVGTHKRLLVTTEAGAPYYTDNDGQSWQQPSGLPTTGILSICINRAGGYKAYATDGQKVYVSADSGRSYTVLQDFGSKTSETKLYSIRYGKQPGAGNVYLARNGSFYKLSGTSFSLRGNYTQPQAYVGNNAWGRFEMGGDTRRLYLHEYNVYMVSTNEGASWSTISPPSYYYGGMPSITSERMISEQTFGVHPENPNILIGGYADWLVSKDGGNSTETHTAGWGHYQGYAGSTPDQWVSTQDQYTREGHHPDLQGSAFFYDKNGQVVSLRYSDGGVYKSYKEWTLPTWTGDDWSVYYNITLYGTPTQETYIQSMASGSNSLDDISWGTQDQGDQTSYGKNGTLLNVLQNPGGDGRNKITLDGQYAYGFKDGFATAPTPLYSNGIFNGTRSMGDPSSPLGLSGTKNLVIDRTNPSKAFWSIGLDGVGYHSWAGWGYTSSTQSLGGSGEVQALAQSTSTPTTLYAVRGGTVYKSTNSGNTWNAGSSWGGNPTDRCGIDINPTDATKALVACATDGAVRAAYTTNGGSTWTNVTGSLPATNIIDLKAEKSGRYYFASTKLGPYAFDSQTSNWYSLGGQYNSAPMFEGMSMEYWPTPNIMRFSTFGQGTWDLQIDNVNTSSGAISSSSTSSSSAISSSSTVSSSSGISSSSSSSGQVVANRFRDLNFTVSQASRQGIQVSSQGDFELRLLNLDGHIIQTSRGSGNQSVQWQQNIAAGAWIVEVHTAQGMRRWMVGIQN